MERTLAILATVAMSGASLHAGNYTLAIDGSEHDIDLDAPQVIRLKDGRKVRVELSKKAIVTFSTDHLSFDHPSEYEPSRTDLGDGIFQTMMSTPLGTLVMIQEYTTINPEGLVDLMINELIKEEADYGYKITKKSATKTLASGTKLSGKMATSRHKDDEYVRHVISYPARDAGLLIITQMERSSPASELKIIDVFWKTLEVSIK